MQKKGIGGHISQQPFADYVSFPRSAAALKYGPPFSVTFIMAGKEKGAGGEGKVKQGERKTDPYFAVGVQTRGIKDEKASDEEEQYGLNTLLFGLHIFYLSWLLFSRDCILVPAKGKRRRKMNDEKDGKYGRGPEIE